MEIPSELASALAKVKRGKLAFSCLSPSHQQEWVQAIKRARRPETRKRMIAQMIAALSQRG